MPLPAPPCPLCGSGRSTFRATLHGRDYWTCPRCHLLFLLPEQRLDPAAERARYDTHENDPDDPRYRAFLSRLFNPLVEKLSPGAEGLDYGAGPGPALQAMFIEAGFPTRIYDPFFAPDRDALRRTYDFVTCTETAEHFFEPGREFQTLNNVLRPGGWLGVMTHLLEETAELENWYYLRDPTHVVLYSLETMEWIGKLHGWLLERPHPHVLLFQKAAGSTSSRGS